MQRHTEFKVGDAVKVPRHRPSPRSSVITTLPERPCMCGCQLVAGGRGVVSRVIDTAGEIEERIVYVTAGETEPFGVPGREREVAFAMGELLPVDEPGPTDEEREVALDRWDEED